MRQCEEMREHQARSGVCGSYRSTGHHGWQLSRKLAEGREAAWRRPGRRAPWGPFQGEWTQGAPWRAKRLAWPELCDVQVWGDEADGDWSCGWGRSWRTLGPTSEIRVLFWEQLEVPGGFWAGLWLVLTYILHLSFQICSKDRLQVGGIRHREMS